MASEDDDPAGADVDAGEVAATTVDVDEWLAETADALDVSAEELQALDAHLSAQRAEYAELIEDVRRRVIQVKREADAKAPNDHEHPELAGDLSRLESELADVEETLTEFDETIESGFENYEAVLEHLLDRIGRLEERTMTVGQAVLEVRNGLDALTVRERQRAAAEAIKLAANRLGVRRATCEDCASTVTISLLTDAECPHCAATIADVQAKRGIFGSHTLQTGDPPAIEGTVSEFPSPDDGESVFAAVQDVANVDDGGES